MFQFPHSPHQHLLPPLPTPPPLKNIISAVTTQITTAGKHDISYTIYVAHSIQGWTVVVISLWILVASQRSAKYSDSALC